MTLGLGLDLNSYSDAVAGMVQKLPVHADHDEMVIKEEANGFLPRQGRASKTKDQIKRGGGTRCMKKLPTERGIEEHASEYVSM